MSDSDLGLNSSGNAGKSNGSLPTNDGGTLETPMKRIRNNTMLIVRPHAKDCAYFNGYNNQCSPWCLPEHRFLPVRRDGYKHPRRGKTGWVVFKCNDPSCHAEIAVHDTWLLERIGLGIHEGRRTGAEPSSQ